MYVLKVIHILHHSNQVYQKLTEMHSLLTTFLENASKVKQNANKHEVMIRYANNVLLSVHWIKTYYQQHSHTIYVSLK